MRRICTDTNILKKNSNFNELVAILSSNMIRTIPKIRRPKPLKGKNLRIKLSN